MSLLHDPIVAFLLGIAVGALITKWNMSRQYQRNMEIDEWRQKQQVMYGIINRTHGFCECCKN